MSNYPEGAQYHPLAPWNDTTTYVKRTVAVTVLVEMYVDENERSSEVEAMAVADLRDAFKRTGLPYEVDGEATEV